MVGAVLLAYVVGTVAAHPEPSDPAPAATISHRDVRLLTSALDVLREQPGPVTTTPAVRTAQSILGAIDDGSVVVVRPDPPPVATTAPVSTTTTQVGTTTTQAPTTTTQYAHDLIVIPDDGTTTSTLPP